MSHAIGRVSGYAPALPTPFDENLQVDYASLGELCDRQISSGATALVVCGTTGEAPTLRPDEHETIIEVAATVSGGRVPVIAGAGSNSTAHAIQLSEAAEAAGADAILSVVPYYNKPGQAGIEAHFRAIAGSVGIPIILYDVPSRTGCELADETLARLAELPRIVGLKDATGDLARPVRLKALAGPDFLLFSGDDRTALPFLLAGGHGCISVTSNVAPGLCRDMYDAWCRGDALGAQEFADPIRRLTVALFCETNPVPLKYALSLFDLILPGVRLPLVELSARNRVEVDAVMARISEYHPAQMIGRLRRPDEATATDICAPTVDWPSSNWLSTA